MKKNFMKALYASGIALAMCGTVTMTSCIFIDSSDNKEVADEDEEEDSTILSGLNGLFNKALSCEDEECDDDMELLGYDTVIDDEDGSEIPVAYFKYQGEVFEVMDIDGDGYFDIAAVDANEDDDISDDEIVDVSDQEISVEDIVQMASSMFEDDSYDDEEEYDDSDDLADAGSRSTAPSRQRREERAEQDLPDYVNNANVKAFRKK